MFVFNTNFHRHIILLRFVYLVIHSFKFEYGGKQLSYYTNNKIKSFKAIKAAEVSRASV